MTPKLRRIFRDKIRNYHKNIVLRRATSSLSRAPLSRKLILANSLNLKEIAVPD